VNRRRLLQLAAAAPAWSVLHAFAQSRVPIADAHSHYGMVSRQMRSSGLAEDMRAQGVALVAWKVVADGNWIRVTGTGIEQSRYPGLGDLARLFDSRLTQMKAYIAEHKLRTVLAGADVDACIAGEAGIVLSSEGADFLEGRVENLDSAYDKGLRHLQFVHYIRTPVGDFQTVAPVHGGLSAMGKQLVEACNAKGILVDLAHSTGESVDQALEIANAPILWSHGWVDSQAGHWQDRYGFLKRRLSLAAAKSIAGRDGVIGLWGFGLRQPGLGWSVPRGGTKAYAYELASLAEKIGPEHVAIGTDIEGVGPDWSVNDYGHVRSVVDELEQMKVPAATIEKIAYGNYARVLKAALKS
jgi:membrane dipeptidase